MSKKRMSGWRSFFVLAAVAFALVAFGSVITTPSVRAVESSAAKGSTRSEQHVQRHVHRHDARPSSMATAYPDAYPGAHSEGDIMRVGEDVTVQRGQRVEEVVVIGGDVTVYGTVLEEIVVVGGNVHVASTGVVGSALFSSDAESQSSIVVVGGVVTQDPGAQIFQMTRTISPLRAFGKPGSSLLNPLSTPFRLDFSFLGWLLQLVFSLLLALIIVALMPRHVAAVQRQLEARPLPSGGWGALGLLAVVPVVTIALVISIVGLLLVLPWALFVLLACFFSSVVVAAFIAQRLLTSAHRPENLMMATVLGVVGTTIITQIPVVGSLVLFAMMVFGVGASSLAVVEWSRARKARKAVAAGPNDSAGSGGPGGSEAPGGSGDAPVVVDVPVEVQSAPVEQQAEAPSEVPQPEQLEQSDEAPVAEQQTEASVEPVAEQQAEAPQLEQPSESSSSEQPAEGAEPPQSARPDEV